jgi:hypothetical protein
MGFHQFVVLRLLDLILTVLWDALARSAPSKLGNHGHAKAIFF